MDSYTAMPSGKSYADIMTPGLVRLEHDEHVVRECDTTLSMRPITIWEHLNATVATACMWPIFFLMTQVVWPKINLKVVLTNKRVSFFYESEPFFFFKPASRSEQHFPLATVAAVQETYGSRTKHIESKETISTIRIWFRSFPDGFPSDFFPKDIFPTSTIPKLSFTNAGKVVAGQFFLLANISILGLLWQLLKGFVHALKLI